MENRAIKVCVGELEYMVRAKSDEHEAVVREAERSLNEMITKYRTLYPKKDMVDLLSFVALNQCITNVALQKGFGATDVANQKETPDAGVNDPKDHDGLRHNISRKDLEANIAKIRRVLQNCGIGVDKVTACKEPMVTFYRVIPSSGTDISIVRSHEKEILSSLGWEDAKVVILQDMFGIEVLNANSLSGND